LEKILYHGTPDDWYDVTRSIDWDNTFTASIPSYEMIYIDDSIVTKETASVRLSSTNNGLRFKTSISQSVIDSYITEYGKENVSIGTLIAPTDLLDDETLCHYIGKAGIDYIDVVAKLDSPFSANDGVNTYAGSIVNIKENNLERDFTAVGYIKIVDGNKTIYIYSETCAERNVNEVAIAAYFDVKDERDSVYKYEIVNDSYYSNIGKFSPYTTEQRVILKELFINISDPSVKDEF
jgi:hypothetical protein